MSRLVTIVAIAALVAGLLYRLATLIVPGMPIPEFFVTEDGYLMLTVARNMAIGNGMSVSNGEIVTNGIQPLATFLFTVPYIVTDGDKMGGLVGVILISTAVSVLAALAIRRFARQTLAAVDPSPVWPLAVAALWFVGPLLVFHSMNALETGLYTLMVVVTVSYFVTLVESPAPYTLRQQVILGVLCGLTFLARIDGSFLVTSLFLVRFLHVQMSGKLGFRGALVEALLPGAISLLCAAPWLIYNYNLFGSIMPISGQSQSLNATLGSNFPHAPAHLFEHMFPMLPIPSGLEATLPIKIFCSVVVLVVVVAFVRQLLRRTDPARVALAAYLLYAVAISGYYSLAFGAPWFLSRYLAPLSPLLIVAAISVALQLVRALPALKPALSAATALSIILCLVLLGRQTLPGVHVQGHFQVVRWIQQNVDEDAWVGAVQTGTVGYWHDRTINLDGKVNPDALRALYQDGHVLRYVVDSKIQYLADWSIAGWAERTEAGFNEKFEVIVNEPERDLTVLKRR